ncbi:LacI family DNA-binding transcriptional regulator [Actinomycetaceae bacterium MB13-C1-2]|nr:LacI family DNA-binding transcriptional regulator [Actinomycetaceae bacterium MB13-C1-2]
MESIPNHLVIDADTDFDSEGLMDSRTTIQEVARFAGVSVGSASRALNQNGASKKMVEKVSAAARELGYHPDAVGRSLRTKRTFQIAFAVADIGNPVYVEMLSTIQALVEPAGYRVVVISTGSSNSSTCDLLADIDSGFVDGVIISPLRLSNRVVEAIRSVRIPLVVLGRPLFDEGIDSVSTDSAIGIRLAVEHVVAQGAQNVVLLNGPTDTTPGSVRAKGFLDACDSFGDTLSSHVVTAEDFTVNAGETGAREFLTRSVPDAIVAANDLLAVGAMKAAHKMGLSIPDDLMVTGMDNTDLASYFEPSLTSVSLGSASRAQAAAEILLSRINGDDKPVHSVEVSAELIKRKSTRRWAE